MDVSIEESADKKHFFLNLRGTRKALALGEMREIINGSRFECTHDVDESSITYRVCRNKLSVIYDTESSEGAGAFLSLSELFYCHCESFKRRTKQSRRIRSEHGTTTESFQRKD